MTDRKDLNSTTDSPASPPGTEINKDTPLITFRKMCVALNQPEYIVRYQLGAQDIKHEYKVGSARIFSYASYLRIKSAIMGIANKKAIAAL